jgi:hypothetical protein
MKAVWLASLEKDWPLEVISLGPAVVVASVYRAWPTQEPPLAMVRPEGDVRDWQTTAVEGKLWDRTSPESRSSRKPSQPVASQPAEAKRSPDA